MCVVSNMGDYYKNNFPWNPGDAGGAGGSSWDPISFNLLQEILKLCKKLDEKMGDRDCEQDEKMEYFKKVGEKLGIPFNLDEKVEDLTFSQALDLMKKGNKVARKGWNGKNMYIYLQREVGDGWNEYVVMKTADNKMQPGWLASQTDMLAEDWVNLGVL